MNPIRQTWNAEDYARNSSAQTAWARELIEKLGLKGSETVLDIGCGDGKITVELARAVGNGSVVGVDLSEEMLRLAGERFPPEVCPNLSFLRMDASDIHLPRRFDVAFSTAALHWVQDQRAVLRGVRDCLKPGGRILFQMGGRGNADQIFEVVSRLVEHPRWRPYFEGFRPPYNFCGPDEYWQWLVETGFRPLRVESFPRDMEHAGTEGLTGWLRTTWFPYTDRLPAQWREPFLAEVAETYLAGHPVDAGGRTHVAMVRLEVEAHSP